VEIMKWKRSSRSGSNGGQCVEMARVPGVREIAARDSKRPDGPQQRYGLDEISALIAGIKSGRYDRDL
jgi:hypothetical protein